MQTGRAGGTAARLGGGIVSAAKYTPSPWATKPEECDRSYIRIRGTRPGSRYKVANVLTPIYEGVSAKEAEETRANALLIAAAPELLEALDILTACLENSIELLGHDPADDARVKKARAAIAKATGSCK